MLPTLQCEILELIEANRARALWSLAPDFMPSTPEATRRFLRLIAACGDRMTFMRARQLLRQLDAETAAIINPAGRFAPMAL